MHARSGPKTFWRQSRGCVGHKTWFLQTNRYRLGCHRLHLWRHDEKRYIIYRYSVDGAAICSGGPNDPPLRRTTLILHAHPRPLPSAPARKIKKGIFEDNLHGTISGTWADGNSYKIDLRGKKFMELDKLLCIL